MFHHLVWAYRRGGSRFPHHSCLNNQDEAMILYWIKNFIYAHIFFFASLVCLLLPYSSFSKGVKVSDRIFQAP